MMDINFEIINWLAVLVSLIVGQIFLTVWFVVIFGTSWAKEYGASDKKQHTKDIPGYTYAIQIICSALLIIGIAILQNNMSVTTIIEGLALGLWIAIFFGVAITLPGYAFLKRWNAFFIALGSQTILILLVSVILAAWN